MISFIEADEHNIAEYENQIYDILSKNMLEILPREGRINAEEYFPAWKTSLQERLRESECAVIVFICDDKTAGFIQYSVCDDDFTIEELHISSEYRVKYNIFGKLVKYLLPKINSDVRFIRARVNRHNKNVNNILTKLGFDISEQAGGRGYLYRLSLRALSAKYL